MKRNGATLNYKFGQKNNWRRTIWNQIGERVTVPTNEAVVLYLAGPDDFDWQIAQGKGFRRHNMIAIENDAGVIRRLRDSGILVIEGDMLSVISAWPASKKVHAVVCDYCSGLTRNVVDATVFLNIWPSYFDAVIAVNTMRGRDSESNLLRKEISETYGPVIGEEFGKHRGKFLYHCVANFALSRLDQTMHNGRTVQKLRGFMRPKFYSYRSHTGQVFDSVVFDSWFKNMKKFDDGVDISKVVWHNKPKDTARRISATLAHRTMRINGTFPGMG